jgi:DGQHR domain-containing protein
VTSKIQVPYLALPTDHTVYLSVLSGRWLLAGHCTPSLRKENPEKGFQRVVSEKRAKAIAKGVLDKGKTFPNAIILATEKEDLSTDGKFLTLPNSTRFLVVDGQHRLYAQKYSTSSADYAAIIHVGMSKVDMAEMFLEINAKQQKVPPSLRWDLYRLVRRDLSQALVTASDIIQRLREDPESALYQRIDLTGEAHEIKVTQASLGPEIARLVGSKKSPLFAVDFEGQVQVIETYLAAIRSLDADAWVAGDSPYYSNRMIRGLVKLLGDILTKEGTDPIELELNAFVKYLKRLKPASFEKKEMLAVGGESGLRMIYKLLKEQAFG